MNTPVMILRIQKEYVKDCNKLTEHWIGVLLHVDKYSVTETKTDMKRSENPLNVKLNI